MRIPTTAMTAAKPPATARNVIRSWWSPMNREADARAAIEAMDPADRLDDPHFVARYRQAVEDYRDHLARERRKKLHVA
jgi:hypothetical protein